MVRRAGVPKGGDSSLDGGTASRIRVASKHGLQVFAVFFGVAALFFVLTFIPFRDIDGHMDLPLPMWIMLSPTLVSLAAGVVTGLIVMVVDLMRDQPHRN